MRAHSKSGCITSIGGRWARLKLRTRIDSIDESLNEHFFKSLEDVQDIMEKYKYHNNLSSPHFLL